MFIKIGSEVFNLSNVRSVSQNEDKKTLNISLLADYEYDVKMTPSEAAALFQKAGIDILKITDNDFVVSKNVVIISQDANKEVSVIYKDGHDESYSNARSVMDIVPTGTSLSETNEEDDETNIDIPRNNGISSDLQEEDDTSNSSIGVRFLIGAVAVGVILYQLYKSGMLK